MTPQALLLLFALGSVWGASFLLIRLVIDEVEPMQIVFVRTLAGAALMLVFVRASRLPVRAPRGVYVRAAVLAVPAFLVPFFLIPWGEQEIESGTAAVLNATMPLFTLFFAALLLTEEDLTPARILGVVLGFAGVVMLIGGDLDDSANLAAKGAMVLSSASYGLAAVGARLLIRRMHPLLLSASMVSCAAVYASVIFFATGNPRADISAQAWAAMLVLGLVSTGIAYVAYYRLIEMVSSVRASFVYYIIPIVGVILGAVALDEHVTWATVAGGFVILAGIAVGTGTVQRLIAPSSTLSRWLRA